MLTIKVVLRSSGWYAKVRLISEFPLTLEEKRDKLLKWHHSHSVIVLQIILCLLCGLVAVFIDSLGQRTVTAGGINASFTRLVRRVLCGKVVTGSDRSPLPNLEDLKSAPSTSDMSHQLAYPSYTILIRRLWERIIKAIDSLIDYSANEGVFYSSSRALRGLGPSVVVIIDHQHGGCPPINPRPGLPQTMISDFYTIGTCQDLRGYCFLGIRVLVFPGCSFAACMVL